ncbi:hypothetical protein DUNSADRAFT_4986 [Dunaliella salina]|uniref:Encoded protein n=1 Tax=Dunaliella salina TaxID=3046 RepID=A0ABQ7GQZ0_DUNSA|nr:hypothetical protein DUNSADRAFT_4986 [Dunaliella salina]|eukprot:KAF5837013.1 hypothetical protein DUNSADRAFT_4986 [Dunaliella salina]
MRRHESREECAVWNRNSRAVCCLESGISGAYDLVGLEGHLHKRGLYNNLFSQIMSINGVPAISELSPLHAARAWSAPDARLPISVTTMDGPILTETSVLAQSPTRRDPLVADHQDGKASSKRRHSTAPAVSSFGARMPTTLFIHGGSAQQPLQADMAM